jgi:hypothetical protein
MLGRLTRRLSDTQNIRYFHDTNSALASYDKDWSKSASAIMIRYFNNIFVDDRKYSFCIILSDESKEVGTRTSTCFKIENKKFTVTKQGVIDVRFFIQLLLYLTNHNLSDIPKNVLTAGTQNLEIPPDVPKKNADLLKEMFQKQKTQAELPKNNETFFKSFTIPGIQKTRIVYKDGDNDSDDDNAAALTRIFDTTDTRVVAQAQRVGPLTIKVGAPPPPATTGFGAAAAPPPAATGYGFGAPAARGFGAPAARGFGAPAATGFGPPAATRFGWVNQAAEPIEEAPTNFGGLTRFGQPIGKAPPPRRGDVMFGETTGYGYYGGGQVIGGKNTKKHFNYRNKNKIKNTSRKN